MPMAWKTVRADGGAIYGYPSKYPPREFTEGEEHVDELGSYAHQYPGWCCRLAVARSRTRGECCRVIEVDYDEADLKLGNALQLCLTRFRVIRELPWDEIVERSQRYAYERP